MARLEDIREAPRNEARKPLAKCVEFFDASQAALNAGRWDAAGLAAIHAGICAGDAALIASAGIRSVSKDHGAIVSLLSDQVPEFTTTQGRQLGGLLKMKNRVEYEQRPLTDLEAKQLVDQASRLARWAEHVVADHLGE